MLKLVLSLAALIFPGVSISASERSADKPNIPVIVGDDMGYADVGFHGMHDFPTPNLDAPAADGVRLTNGYVSGKRSGRMPNE